jgi:CHAT domain-containing protein
MTHQAISEEAIIHQMMNCQQRVARLLPESTALMQQGRLREAEGSFAALIAALREQLALAELNNQLYGERPYELPPIVEPLVNALMTWADVLEAQGEREAAKLARTEALELSQNYLPSLQAADRARQRAEVLATQGRFNEALVSLVAVREALPPDEAPLQYALASTTLAGIYEWLGDYERAEAEARATRQLLQANGQWRLPLPGEIWAEVNGGDLKQAEISARLFQIQMNLLQIEARSARYLGNLEESARLFERVYAHTETWVRPAIAFQFAAIQVEAGRHREGLQAVEALEPAFTGLLRPKLGVLYKLKGEALLGLGYPREALQYLQAAVEELDHVDDKDSLWRALWVQARAWRAADDRQAALRTYEEMATVINSLHRAPLGYRLDSTYLREKLPAFEEAITLAAAEGATVLCCQLIEMVKSRILSSVLSIPRGTAGDRADVLSGRLDSLSQQIDGLDYQWYSGKGDDSLLGQRAVLQQERSALLEQQRFSDPRWRALSEPAPFAIDEIAAHLATKGQAALSLFAGPHEIVSVLLKDSRVWVGSVPLRAEVHEAIEQYQENLEAEKPHPAWYDVAAHTGLEAAHLIPAGLLALAVEGEALLISPHGALHLLPWAGLPFQGRRLFEYCPVAIIPNLRVIPALAAQPAGAARVALIGGPDYSGLSLKSLDAALVELQEVESIYQERIIDRAYTEEEATEAAFWSLVNHPEGRGNILHVACHGTLNQDDPMDAALLLADGRVDAAEIARRRIAYQEVVLSACSTGYRPTRVAGIDLTGDEILGLPGAFLEAGVRSVLVSIPPARDDAAMTFMRIFHRLRYRGADPLAALQKTQTRMLEDSTYPPYLWIGFALYGGC